MLEAQVDATMRRTAAGLDLLEDRVAADVTRDDVFAILGDAVVSA